MHKNSGLSGKSFFTAFLIFYFLGSGCSFNTFMVDQAAGLMESGKAAFETESDLQIAETALASNLKLLEALLQKDPQNPGLRVFLAQGYSLFAMAFVEDRFEEFEHSDPERSELEKKRAILFYNRARDYASVRLFKSLKISGIQQINKEGLADYLSKARRSDVPHLFWFGFSWGSAINLQRDDIMQLANLPYIEMIMGRIRELDEQFYFGGVHLFNGMYYGGRPPMLGGDMERSAKSFARAAVITENKLLLIPYFKARTYCIQIQDTRCFRENLEYVLKAPEEIYPEQKLANALAKKKARRLLGQFENYFLEEEIIE